MRVEFAVVSPSSTMTSKFRKVLAERKLSCPVVQASQKNAIPVAKQMIGEGAKIIISRGNTARMLRSNLEIPVIEEKHTFFDCYIGYQKALKISDKIAFLATSDSFLKILNKSKPLLKNALICPIDAQLKEEYVRADMEKLAQMGIEVAIGGISLRDLVTQCGIQYIMTETDEDAVNDAIDEALYHLKIEDERLRKNHELKRKHEMIQAVMNCTLDGIFSVDQEGIVTNINENAHRMLPELSPGQPIDKILKGDFLDSTLKHRETLSNVLINTRKSSLILNIAPVCIKDSVIGATVTVQYQHEIQKMEQKIRHSLLTCGHISDKTFEDIIGSSPALRAAKSLAQRYAAVDSTVLILGDTGTGKELFAQSIHNASRRKSAPFVAINCAALPASVLESELFGYVKGAFTGARSEGKAGMFELAHNGTIFLDEISETPPDVQLKLLRVIQERKVIRLGDDRVTSVDVRIIAASNKDLRELVQNGLFREDFYYRICVLELQLPTLDERREDIPDLVRCFLKNPKLPSKKITEEALNLLMKQQWRGNIRQLNNIVERLAVICDTDTITADLVEQTVLTKPRTQREEVLPQYGAPVAKEPMTERELIRSVLHENKGNRERSARQLGISTTTLWRKVKKIQELEPGYFELVRYFH